MDYREMTESQLRDEIERTSIKFDILSVCLSLKDDLYTKEDTAEELFELLKKHDL
ncbi:hypothetical protein [Bacillus sp. S/N-304-OC-R1]|uniref:hypothetical protein n=1 Tax=Bacillus sp. S/N-304-OC-R1 TaxID=2758034 RepID=UPI001C8E5F79|nr:hypothetical protein [Bacillus sp. S/N-304-OC-R1]MBY0124509.1 hypothetical protein [Bacillus sp. S/N-304-OC-R1]